MLLTDSVMVGWGWLLVAGKRSGNQEFCKEIHPFLIPIQMGEKDAGEVLSVSRDVSEQYFREEDEAATMAEIGMM